MLHRGGWHFISSQDVDEQRVVGVGASALREPGRALPSWSLHSGGEETSQSWRCLGTDQLYKNKIEAEPTLDRGITMGGYPLIPA